MNAHLYNDYAKAKCGVPDGWTWYSLHAGGKSGNEDVPANTVRMIGCVPSCNYKSGPRKGTPNFRKPVEGTHKVFWVTDADLLSFIAEWESSTGNCSHCYGKGKTVASIDFVKKHTEYKPCAKCGGSGRKS